VYDIDEERENIPPEIVEEGHRIINKCKDTGKLFVRMLLSIGYSVISIDIGEEYLLLAH
jgi:hypothetical protein